MGRRLRQIIGGADQDFIDGQVAQCLHGQAQGVFRTGFEPQVFHPGVAPVGVTPVPGIAFGQQDLDGGSPVDRNLYPGVEAVAVADLELRGSAGTAVDPAQGQLLSLAVEAHSALGTQGSGEHHLGGLGKDDVGTVRGRPRLGLVHRSARGGKHVRELSRRTVVEVRGGIPQSTKRRRVDAGQQATEAFAGGRAERAHCVEQGLGTGAVAQVRSAVAAGAVHRLEHRASGQSLRTQAAVGLSVRAARQGFVTQAGQVPSERVEVGAHPSLRRTQRRVCG